MNFIRVFLAIIIVCVAFVCKAGNPTGDNAGTLLPEGEFVFNLPCKIVNIHPEKPGKALLFIWLHGGVKDRPKHNLFAFNHLDCCDADDMIIRYLQANGIKAIALLPVCHQAVNEQCVTWSDCWNDVKRMIDDFVNHRLIDPARIYLAGSSDGGTGTWDYVEQHPDVFAAAIAMSCNRPRMTSTPTFFFNTADETDCSSQVAQLKRQGSNILTYRHCADAKHGDDARQCTDDLLARFFSFSSARK